VAEIMTKAGLRGVSLHTIRHTHASHLLSEGVPIPTVSKRLGHTNPTITLKLYSHALESDELAAPQRWDDAFADVVEVDANVTPAKWEDSATPISITPRRGAVVRRGSRVDWLG
jgi:hypothetical protein